MSRFRQDVADCFKECVALKAAAVNARMAIDMLCVALRDSRVTPYPPREKVLTRLKVAAEILNAVAPRSPLRASFAQEVEAEELRNSEKR